MTTDSHGAVPTNTPDAFGPAGTQGGDFSFFDFASLAPAANPARPRPAVQRVRSGPGADHILFTFTAGQDLPSHKAAHPITVQVISGAVDFECQGTTHRLTPSQAVYLPAYLMHSVSAADAAVILLTMHTG